MIGAIIGDIVGSKYEFNNIKTKEFPLFSEGCSFTDDTVLTIAVADWLLNGGDLAERLVAYGRQHPQSDQESNYLNSLAHSGPILSLQKAESAYGCYVNLSPDCEGQNHVLVGVSHRTHCLKMNKSFGNSGLGGGVGSL